MQTGHTWNRKDYNEKAGTLLCPLCAAVLSNSEMGINGHLWKHIRKGELGESERLELREKMLGREIKHR